MPCRQPGPVLRVEGLVGDVRRPVYHAENWLDKRPSISSIAPPGARRELDGRRGAKAAQAEGLRMGRCRADNLDQCSMQGAGRRRATRIDTPVQDGRDRAAGEEPGPCRSLSSGGVGAAQNPSSHTPL